MVIIEEYKNTETLIAEIKEMAKKIDVDSAFQHFGEYFVNNPQEFAWINDICELEYKKSIINERLKILKKFEFYLKSFENLWVDDGKEGEDSPEVLKIINELKNIQEIIKLIEDSKIKHENNKSLP